MKQKDVILVVVIALICSVIASVVTVKVMNAGNPAMSPPPGYTWESYGTLIGTKTIDAVKEMFNDAQGVKWSQPVPLEPKNNNCNNICANNSKECLTGVGLYYPKYTNLSGEAKISFYGCDSSASSTKVDLSCLCTN